MGIAIRLTLRALPRRGQAAPGSQKEEICAQFSSEPSAFDGKPWEDPLIQAVIFHVKVAVLYTDMNGPLQGSIHQAFALFIFIALGGGSC